MTATDDRVLLLAPTSKDATMTQQLFAGIGVDCTACSTVHELCEQIQVGASAVVLTDHASRSPAIQDLVDLVRQQPPWSDLPILVLARNGAESLLGRQAMDLLGNVTVLERPVRMASFASVVRTLTRSRQRQYQIREHLRERERSAEQMRLSELAREALLVSERAARNEAERVSRVKDEFLATLSHELRTPLNAILGWSQILSRTMAGNAEVAEILQVIERNARAQTKIIEDLLDMSRILNGKVRLEVGPLQIANVLDAAVETILPAATAKDIQVVRAVDPVIPMVVGDPNRLQQVFWNLLSNAIKFTPKCGSVAVTLRAENGQVEVRVKDTGEGVHPEFLPHVFDRFRQADASTTRYHGGLGLGLAIVKQLVELHGGTITATSDGKGKGSEFAVHLPLRADYVPATQRALPAISPLAAARPTIQVDTPAKLAGVHVLVVDDEPDARLLVKRILENEDAAVVAAASTAEAMDQIHRRRPDLVISDIGMPGLDGYALIRELRSLDALTGGRIPAIAMTAYVRSEDRDRALQSGYQRHMAKPIEAEELIALVASLTGRDIPVASGTFSTR